MEKKGVGFRMTKENDLNSSGSSTTQNRQVADASEISTFLDSLACQTFGICLSTLEEGKELWPILMYYKVGERPTGFTFKDDTPENCYEAARNEVRTLPGEVMMYAIGYDGFVQTDEEGTTVDAVIVEFGERGSRCAFSAYAPYTKGKTPEEFNALEPLPAGEEELLLG